MNPKQICGQAKPPLHLLPGPGLVETAMALEYGAYRAGPDGTGYGPFNWRETQVEVMTYVAAIQRHLLAFVDGENFAADSRVHHFGHIAAGSLIVLDAYCGGQLIDNRPPPAPTAHLLRAHTNVPTAESPDGEEAA